MGSGSSTQIQSIKNDKTEPFNKSRKAGADVDVSQRKDSRNNMHAQVLDKTTDVFVVEIKPSQLASSSDAFSSEDQSTLLQSLEVKVKQLGQELADSEIEKLDLQDRVQMLEERLAELTTSNVVTSNEGNDNQDIGQETLKAKDQYIQRLEQELANAQEEATKMRTRLKKRIKALTMQLNETKQESSIAQLEMKEHYAELREQLTSSHGIRGTAEPKNISQTEDVSDDSKMKVILNLSSQISEQADRIEHLERLVKDRDLEIRRLKEKDHNDVHDSGLSDLRNALPGHKPSTKERVKDSSKSMQSVQSMKPASRTADLQLGSRSKVTPVHTFNSDQQGGFSSKSYFQSQESISERFQKELSAESSQQKNGELFLRRQSTALSDSDSDWEVDTLGVKPQSAPPRASLTKASAFQSSTQTTSSTCTYDDSDLLDLAADLETVIPQEKSRKQKKKSVLKSRLEKDQRARSDNSKRLSVTFGVQTLDHLTDTSSDKTSSVCSNDNVFELSSTKIMSSVM